MTLETKVGDIDTRQVLAALKGYDKTLQKETLRTIRRSARVIVKAAQANTPAEPPMSGWRTVPAANGRTRGGRGWPAWVNTRTGFSTRIGRRTRIRATNEIRWDLVRIVATRPTAAIFEFAKEGQTAQGRQFVANLNRYRTPSRAVWPAVDQHRDAVENDMMEAVRRAADIMNRKVG